MSDKYEAVIIGGGFYGLSIAIYLTKNLGLKKVLVIEKDNDYMQRASYNNQARIHNGYHYPRSLLTGIRSRINLPIFVQDYPEAVVSDFDKYYAVARAFSKVSAKQFYKFSERIGSEISPVPTDIKELFNPKTYRGCF
jgi:L-2-hydroxyglutarate oxidase LhgO